MSAATLSSYEIHATYDVRKLRRAAALTRMQLAELAAVSFRHVGMFERGLPVPLDSRRRILRQLWAINNQS